MEFLAGATREWIYVKSIARTLYRMRHLKPDSTQIVSRIVEDIAARKPGNIAILCPEQTVTYRELDEGANRYAHWAQRQNLRRGDVVALLMENRPDYIMVWLGLHKLGIIAALINTNLRGQPLAHSIQVAEARHIIVGAECSESYSEAAALLETRPTGWCAGGAAPELQDLDAVLAQMPSTRPATDDIVRCRDKAFYIYTSGTTGLPKAANISHTRALFMMYGFAGALGARETDRMYNVLPLYHSAGGLCAMGPPLLTGGSVILKRKFSVREFWDDCHAYKPTFFQYIGELCRYLLNAPPHPLEQAHQLRAITGNGLRPDIWRTFQKRFAIPKIIEFYGATEGNVSMLNYDGTVGAVGRIPRYARKIFHVRIIRFDVEHETPVRGPGGLCIECAHGEAGEAVGKIVNEPGRTFEGYTKDTDTEKKILRNVFKKGDAWFRTGDLMRRDAHGYFYFVDRIGDTFRWKGENVSTSEVAEVLGVIAGVKEANVYGVHIPGQDGRAGMAALVVGPDFDITALGQTLADHLPGYAKPVFLRLQPELEVTGTFKQRKIDLVREGFDPRVIRDPLYALDPQANRYLALDDAAYRAIVSGRVKL